MSILVTGSSGHLGEALMRTLKGRALAATGLDRIAGPFTDAIGSIADRTCVRQLMAGARTVLHAATLHKPHVGTHDREAFVETNVRGTLILLEEAVAAGVESFVFTSTTSAFGDALVPPPGEPAAWITEAAPSIPKNIYGVTKTAAEDLCQLFHRNERLPCIVLRTSRFFPEEDDSQAVRAAFSSENTKMNEFLCRRVDIEDVVAAHLIAARRAPRLGFGKFIVSATTPFLPNDLATLREDAPSVAFARVPEFAADYQRRGWRMFPSVDRVYVNAKARRELGWAPQWDFLRLVRQLQNGEALGSDLARLVGAKGYHPERFADGPYPVGSVRG